MNRRGFLKNLGIGAATVVVAGSVGMSGLEWMDASEPLGQYVDYTNFSQMALSTSMDELVQKVAVELAEAHATRINWLVEGKLSPFWSDDDE